MKDLLKVLVFGSIFLIPLLPIYVENDFFFPFITGKNFAFRLIIEFAFAAWILLALLDKQYRPKFSWMFAAFGTLVIVMFFANILGEYPPKSFWSNFERMDGYITLVHVFLLMVVAGSIMTTEKLWTWFFHVSTTVALLVVLFGLAQVSGLAEGGRGRLDSRLGNAAYMAVYLLFHLFIVGWLIIRSKNKMVWLGGGIVIAIFAYALLLTATRGTILGFIGGATVAVAYTALFGRKYPELRKFAIGGFLALVILALGFVAVKDTDFIQDNNALARIANIDIAKDLETRGVIWSMALDGVKERPILGWGQGSFNYIFNKNFEPVLYNKEAWFDRVHDIVLDWLVAGGILGFLAYASIFVALLYYLLYLPLFKHDERIDVLERAVIIGLLTGYLMHNLVVFDNIISYIFFACIIALVHFRVGENIKSIQEFEIDDKLVTQMIAPAVFVIVIGTMYFLNVPGILASKDIINAMRESTVQGRLENFHKALERNSFANQEIVEQLVQQAMGAARNQRISEEERQAITQRAELEMLQLIDEKPGDARLHNFLATFYRTIGAYPQAREQAAIARSLSPRKPSIVLEQGVIELQMGNLEGARDFFKEAYELETSNSLARVFYASTEVQLGNIELAKELIGDEHLREFATNDFALSSVNSSGDMEFLAELFEKRVELSPGSAQDWASLAYAYYQLDETDKAIDALQRASSSAPTFAKQANCFIDNLEAGNEPTEGCTAEATAQ